MRHMKKYILIVALVLVAVILTGCQESPEAKYNRAVGLVSEGKYEEAIPLFEENSAYGDSNKMAMYTKAIMAGEKGDYETAFSGFEALGDFKDSPMMITYYTGRQYESQAGDENWNAWLQAAETYEKISLFQDSADRAAACRRAVYDYAVSKVDEGDYDMAYSVLDMVGVYEDSLQLIDYCGAFLQERNDRFTDASEMFSHLGDYRDSAEQATAVLQRGYDKASGLEASGDQEGAYRIFMDLGGYSDSFERANKPYYDLGIIKRDVGEWNESVAAFEHAGRYNDAAEQILATRYAEGVAKREAKDWDGAVTAFTLAGGYNDAATQILATRYAEGEAKRETKDWDGAIATFESLGGYSDAVTQISETRYQQAKFLMDSGDYTEALAILINLKGYRDVDNLLENDENLIAAIREAKRNLFKIVGGNVTFGQYRQTKEGTDKTPIEWIVLDYDEANHRALLISRYGLDAKPYNTQRVDVTWETSSLRTWLNNDFLNRAFSAEEQSAILLTDVDNSDAQVHSGWRASGGSNTQDQIFLLSIVEATSYFNVKDHRVSGSDRNTASRVAPTEYARVQRKASTSSFYRTADGRDAGEWWLRSPGKDSNYAAYISYDGSLHDSYVTSELHSIRPAIWINLESDYFNP